MASEAGMSQEDFEGQTKRSEPAPQGEIPEEIKEWVKEKCFEVFPYVYDDDAHCMGIDAKRHAATKIAMLLYHKMQEELKLLEWYKSAYLEFQHNYNVTCERSDELKNALELIIKKSKVLLDNPNCKDISEIARIALNK